MKSELTSNLLESSWGNTNVISMNVSDLFYVSFLSLDNWLSGFLLIKLHKYFCFSYKFPYTVHSSSHNSCLVRLHSCCVFFLFIYNLFFLSLFLHVHLFCCVIVILLSFIFYFFLIFLLSIFKIWIKPYFSSIYHFSILSSHFQTCLQHLFTSIKRVHSLGTFRAVIVTLIHLKAWYGPTSSKY